MEALEDGKVLDDMIDEKNLPADSFKELKELRELFDKRTRLASYISSDCHVMSGSEGIVDIIDDVPGFAVEMNGYANTYKCMDKKPRDGPWCFENILTKEYKFYFVMETALCNEYVTETLYNTLKYGLVPVVYGGRFQSKYCKEGIFV